MSDKMFFSKHYSQDTTRHEDKAIFRNRLLKYLEDLVNESVVIQMLLYQSCRTKMGIDLQRYPTMARTTAQKGEYHYEIEKTFSNPKTPVSQILDFISLVYDSLQNLGSNTQNQYISAVNVIFHEESMCYTLDHNGRVRYSPDEEFHLLVKSTLTLLNNAKYRDNLENFNNVLDQAYKKRNKESPVNDLFRCVEGFALTLLNSKKHNRVSKDSVTELLDIIQSQVDQDIRITENDKKAFLSLKEMIWHWVQLCHKYRHGKPNQTEENVPGVIFDYIFSTGISIFRFLLQADDEYGLISGGAGGIMQ